MSNYDLGWIVYFWVIGVLFVVLAYISTRK